MLASAVARALASFGAWRGSNETVVRHPPTAAFSADVTSGDAPLTVTFTDESTYVPDAWLWDFGDGETSTEQNPVHEYAEDGTYTVTLTASNNGGSDDEIKVDYITATVP